MELQSIISTATITDKSENQDCRGEFEGSNFKTISVADGLGTYTFAKLASENVIDYFTASASKLDSSIKENEKGIQLNLKELFLQAKSELIKFSKEFLKDKEVISSNLFGTTAITVFETKDKIIITYVGNGAIWHIRGSYNVFTSPYLFPWNSINLLNPHSLPENGKEALIKLISVNDDFHECIPSVIEISKDEEFGDIILICTDGISSADQCKAGENSKGIYVKYEPSILKFYEYLTRFFKSSETFTKENLNLLLNKYLEELKPTLNDDATIGVLITKEALNYQSKYSVNIENNQNKDI
ncbi:MAG: protein phosphatase 2C domain-containing protein [Bacteroidota bacterium]|jgi:serine/threonine protein phosphatase PrpC